jgi:hypothetical protein
MMKWKTMRPAQLEMLLGHWVWAAMARRPVLAFIFVAYKWLAKHPGNKPQPIWETLRTEMRFLCDLAPLFVTELRRDPASITYASDASDTGYGVARALGIAPHGKEAWETVEPWHDLFWGAWSSKANHINASEAIALSLTVQHAATRAVSAQEILLLVDNQAALFAAKKGRSSSWSLNSVIRRQAAYVLAARLYPKFLYVPSEHNPSDAASRKGERPGH